MNKIFKIFLATLLINSFIFETFANVSTSSDLNYYESNSDSSYDFSYDLEELDEYIEYFPDVIYPTTKNIEDYISTYSLTDAQFQDALKSFIYNYMYKAFGFNMTDSKFFTESNSYYQNPLYYLSASFFNRSDIIDWSTIYSNYKNNGTLVLSELDFVNLFNNYKSVFGPYVTENDNKFEFFLNGEYDIPMELSRVNVSNYPYLYKTCSYSSNSSYSDYGNVYKYCDSNTSRTKQSKLYNVSYQPYFDLTLDSSHLVRANSSSAYNYFRDDMFSNVSYLTQFNFLPSEVLDDNVNLGDNIYFTSAHDFYSTDYYNFDAPLPNFISPSISTDSSTTYFGTRTFFNVYLPAKSDYLFNYEFLHVDSSLNNKIYSKYLSDFIPQRNNGVKRTYKNLYDNSNNVYSSSSVYDGLLIICNKNIDFKFDDWGGHFSSFELNDNYNALIPYVYYDGKNLYSFDNFLNTDFSSSLVNAYNFEIPNFNKYGTDVISLSNDDVVTLYNASEGYEIDVSLFEEYMTSLDTSSNVFDNLDSDDLGGVTQDELDDFYGREDEDIEAEGTLTPTEFFLSSISKGIEDVANFIGEGFNNLVEGVTEGYEGIKETVTNVASNISELPTNLWNGFKAGFEWISDGLSNIWDSIVELPNAMWEGFKAGFNWITEQLGNIWNAITELPQTMWNFFKAGYESITNSLSDIWNAITDLPNTLWNAMKNGFEWVTNAIQNVVESIGNLATWFWEKFKAGFEWIAEGLANIWSAILSLPESIWNFFKAGFEWIVEGLSNIVNAITNLASAFVDTIVNAFKILFVPDEEFFNNKIEELKSLLEQKIPLSVLSGYYDGFFNQPVMVMDSVPDPVTMTLPVALGGATVTVLSFDWFEPYHDQFILFETFTIWAMFGMAILKKIRRVVSAK